MLDYPPHLRAYEPGDPHTPDTHTPVRFLGWVLRVQAPLVALQTVASLFWIMPTAVSPYVVGRIIDAGITHRDAQQALWWIGALIALSVASVVADVVEHTIVVRTWLTALFGVQGLVVKQATRLGHVLARRTPTGEVLSVSAGDSDIFGAVIEGVTRFIASVAAIIAVGAIVLHTSLELGLITLVAAPLVVVVSSPLLRPLHRARHIERERNSVLTGHVTDIVAGLRILRGIGGEQIFGDRYAVQSQATRRASVRTGTWQGGIDAMSVLASGLVLVLLTWLGGRQLVAGELTVGQLVSFLGFAVFLVSPIRTIFEVAQRWIEGLVAARKTVALLGQEPPWVEPDDPAAWVDGPVRDADSGLVVEPGRLTVVVSATQDESAALADRLGRYLPTADVTPPDERVASRLSRRESRRAKRGTAEQRSRIVTRDEDLARAAWGVTVAGTDLSRFRLQDIRRHILVADTAATVFSGTLQDAVDPWGTADRAAAEEVLRVAEALDVYEGLPDGWRSRLDEKARGLSGGQRQRVILARALLADPSILVLVEPTSAVDAHTEAAVAAGVARHRTGRTTVVMTSSPLWLHHADRVALLERGRIVAVGTHADLFATSPLYRATVARGIEEEVGHE